MKYIIDALQIKIILVFAITVLTIACNEEKDPGNVESKSDSPSTNNIIPNADAGEHLSVTSGDEVFLVGSSSNDSDGSIISFQWIQTNEPKVTLQNANTANASFIAPEVTETVELIFNLEVIDDAGESNSAQSKVTVIAPDKSIESKAVWYQDGVILLANGKILDWNNSIAENRPVVICKPNDQDCKGELDNIKQIATNHELAVALTFDGNVIVWKNSDKEKEPSYRCKKFNSDHVCVEKFDNVIDVTTHAFLLEDGVVPGVEQIENDIVSTLSSVINIESGLSHTLALKNDGSVWSWGSNSNGQLGRDCSPNTRECRLASKIFDDVDNIFVGGNHSYVLKNDGSLWGWGDNSRGQLGVKQTKECIRSGYRECPLDPFRITNFDNVKYITGSLNYTAAIKNDGSLWIWGEIFTSQYAPAYDIFIPVKVCEKYELENGNNCLEYMSSVENVWVGQHSGTITISTLEGELLTWGGRDYGVRPNEIICNKSEKTVHFPTEITRIPPIKSVISNRFLIDINNMIWRKAPKHSCVTSSTKDNFYFTPMKSFPAFKFVSADLGAIVTESNEVFHIAHDNDGNYFSKQICLTFDENSECNEKLGDVKKISVRIALQNDGRVVTWKHPGIGDAINI